VIGALAGNRGALESMKSPALGMLKLIAGTDR